MTSYGAVESWGTRVEVPTEVVHLTRRGRLVRATVLLAALLVGALWAVGRLTDQPALAQESVGPIAVPTLRVTVEEGDSLWAIARHTSPQIDPREVVLDIRELNGLTSNTIQPGQELLVPASG
jgi:LysM repeat protein